MLPIQFKGDPTGPSTGKQREVVQVRHYPSLVNRKIRSRDGCRIYDSTIYVHFLLFYFLLLLFIIYFFFLLLFLVLVPSFRFALSFFFSCLLQTRGVTCPFKGCGHTIVMRCYHEFISVGGIIYVYWVCFGCAPIERHLISESYLWCGGHQPPSCGATGFTWK